MDKVIGAIELRIQQMKANPPEAHEYTGMDDFGEAMQHHIQRTKALETTRKIAKRYRELVGWVDIDPNGGRFIKDILWQVRPGLRNIPFISRSIDKMSLDIAIYLILSEEFDQEAVDEFYAKHQDYL